MGSETSIEAFFAKGVLGQPCYKAALVSWWLLEFATRMPKSVGKSIEGGYRKRLP